MTISGPLPSASEMRGYNEISPDLVNRIVTLAEKETEFRHSTERNIIEVNYELAKEHQKERKRGQIIGAIVSFMCLLTSGYLGYLGHPTAAGIVGGTTVIGLVAVFVTGQYSANKDK